MSQPGSIEQDPIAQDQNQHIQQEDVDISQLYAEGNAEIGFANLQTGGAGASANAAPPGPTGGGAGTSAGAAPTAGSPGKWSSCNSPGSSTSPLAAIVFFPLPHRCHPLTCSKYPRLLHPLMRH